MSELKSITIAFESVEEIEIPASDIKTISLSGVTESIHWSPVSDYIIKHMQCENLYLQLKPEANKIKPLHLCNGETVFDRIKLFNDITFVAINCYNEDPKRYYIKWDNALEENGFQSVATLKNGCLLVVCSPNETAEALKRKYEKPIKYMDTDAC